MGLWWFNTQNENEALRHADGDFTSVQAAAQSIPMNNHERTIILIKDGVYDEKVRIDASCVTLHGESRAGVHIQFPWANGQGRDAFGNGVVNINGDDCVLENLTVVRVAETKLQ